MSEIDVTCTRYKSCKWAKYDKYLKYWKCKLFYTKLKPIKCEYCKNYE